jgi:DNA processing protein
MSRPVFACRDLSTACKTRGFSKEITTYQMDTILPWFALKSVPGVGNILFKRLMDCFKSPASVFNASDDELLQVEGLTPRLVSAIKQHHVPVWVKGEIDDAARQGYRIVTQSDPEYPSLLLQIPDPPPYLYVAGRLETQGLHIAVVGSRHATSYGLATAKRFCAELAAQKVTIVSGMAKGIDTAAHHGALEAGGKTIAVLGSGLERIYPVENRQLFERICRNGAVISEFSLHSEPEAHHFPIRNRIISGISHGTVIVEASQKSGSLITARLAAEQNREVFAVPGNINSFKSAGTHSLIKQGAKLVGQVQDILEEFGAQGAGPAIHLRQVPLFPLPDLTDEEKRVLDGLGPYPLHIDELNRTLPFGSGSLGGILLQLEVKGMIQRSPGNYFALLVQREKPGQ